MDLRGRTQEEAGRNCIKNAYENLVGKTKRRGILGESILPTAFLLTLILKKLDGRV
jgi:hypothetical protein